MHPVPYIMMGWGASGRSCSSMPMEPDLGPSKQMFEKACRKFWRSCIHRSGGDS